MKGVGDGQVGGQRHPRVAILALQPGVEAELPAVVGELEHLFGELDSRCVSTILGGDDAPRQLGERRRERVHVDVLVGQLPPAVDDGALCSVEPGLAGGIDAHDEHNGGPRARREQARRLLGQGSWIERHLAVRQVHRATALPGLAIEHAVRVDEEADVGDGVVQHDVVAGLLDGERLVEIGGRRRIERHVVDRRAIDVVGPGLPGCRLIGRSDHVAREVPRNAGLGADRIEAC